MAIKERWQNQREQNLSKSRLSIDGQSSAESKNRLNSSALSLNDHQKRKRSRLAIHRMRASNEKQKSNQKSVFRKNRS